MKNFGQSRLMRGGLRRSQSRIVPAGHGTPDWSTVDAISDGGSTVGRTAVSEEVMRRHMAVDHLNQTFHEHAVEMVPDQRSQQ